MLVVSEQAHNRWPCKQAEAVQRLRAVQKHIQSHHGRTLSAGRPVVPAALQLAQNRVDAVAAWHALRWVILSSSELSRIERSALQPKAGLDKH